MGEELSQTERLLMGELFKLGQEISSFVLRAMGADAEQTEPITAKEEFELGVRLAELGAVLRVRGQSEKQSVVNKLPTQKLHSEREGIRGSFPSSKRQMDTAADIDPEGNSIPTQRLATQGKAKQVGCVVIDEYVEPGKSAKSIDKRPVFQEMMRRIATQRDVDYVIVYQMSRAFRNVLDQLATEAQLKAVGVELISATEDFGSGYMAKGLKTIIGAINEMRIDGDGVDIKTKMLHKAQNGGTNGRAKIGYVNAKLNIDGRKVNSIILDEERAKYVLMAFELCASGKYPNAETLQTALTDAGLRMAGTGKPVSTQTIHTMLRDRYYIGYVTYKGMEYPGRHPKLIDEELFDKVQAVLNSHSGSGTRQRTHHHYLRGTIWCGRCQHRYIVQRGLGNGGEYFYFLCRGRQDGECDQRYVPVDVMEEVVVKHYATEAWLPAEVRQAVRAGVEAAIASYHGLSEELRASLAAQLAKGERKESYLIDLAAEEGWPKDVLREKIQAIRDERSRIKRQLDDSTRQLEAGRQVFTRALDLLDDPHGMYERAHGNEAVRSILNRAFFSKLYIDGGKVTGQELNEPFDMLQEAYTIYRQRRADRQATGQRRTYHRTSGALALACEPEALDSQAELAAWLGGGQTASSAVLLAESGAARDLHIAATRENFSQGLALALAGQGWSNDVMVGAAGLEPATARV